MKRLSTCSVVLVAAALLGGQPEMASAQTTVSGLVHLWSGEGNGNDAVGGANGILGTTTAFGTGLKGQAFSFDAQQSSVVTLPVNINPWALPQMTVGMFVKLRSIPNNLGWVFGHDDGGYDRSLNLHDIRYNFGVAGGTGVNPHPSYLQLSLNQWHCVAASYDAATQTATFYADGVSYSVYANPGSADLTATLGGLKNFGGHTVDGLVDEVFLFNRALSPAEIDQVCAELSYTNQPPEVSAAAPSISSIWPPNNKMVDITINGVTDPDGDAVSIEITSITNNETGSSDAGGLGTSTAQVRAARNGKGNGRTYTISFTAADGEGGTTSGSVTVAVPHDQGRAKPAAVESSSWGEIKSMER